MDLLRLLVQRLHLGIVFLRTFAFGELFKIAVQKLQSHNLEINGELLKDKHKPQVTAKELVTKQMNRARARNAEGDL